MAERDTFACRPCEARNKSTQSDYWCIECHDMLCEECNGHHSVAKSSNNHTIISIEKYAKLPESVLNISPLCKDHGMKYYHFCTSHETLCCPSCVASTHKSCPDLQLLDDVIKTAKTSSLIDEVEKSMKDVKSNLEKIISERGQNISELQKQEREIKEKICNTRKYVNQHIDALEESMLSELNRIEESETKKLQQLMANLTAKLDMVKNKLAETTMLKQYASDLQTFVGTRELDKAMEKETTYIEHLSKDGSLNIQELQCSINDKIQGIMADIQMFGSVSVVSKPSTIRLTSIKDKQAQLSLSSSRSNKITFENATIELKFKFNIHHGSHKTNLKGCSVLPNGKIVIADSGNSHVIIVTESGRVEKEIRTVGGGPYDVTVIDAGTIAISTDKGVQVIDVNTETVGKTFDVGRCYGLCYRNGMLYSCVYYKGVVSIEVSAGRSRIVIDDKHNKWSYCAVGGDQLYYTRSDKKGVQCYSILGEKIWECGETTLIDCPLGVTIDGNGNVYLASYYVFLASSYNNQVLIISPDGQRCRTILSGDDGIVKPWGIYFNKNKNELCVSCKLGQCFTYEIK